MSKKLIMINGTMGVGKSTVCRELNRYLQPSVWLDGDWCWMMNPFVVNDENCRMVEDNITHLLRNFLTNSSYEYILFNWVIHQESIFDTLLKPLKGLDFKLYKITLTCSEMALRLRMAADNRGQAKIEPSLDRLKLYETMDTIKIDNTQLSVAETVMKILSVINK